MATALDNLRVLDFSRVLAGPFATMMLADLGATVTKVERPGTGDDTRAWGPPYDAAGEATYFQSVNRNKESLAVDLRDPGDLARARRLALGADVVVENFRPGLMAELGLGYDDLRAENPGLIYCSITGFGRGAGAALPGYDLLVQALGGLMSITGPADGEPQKVGVALVDVLAGLFSTVGILAALEHRRASGTGQWVEVDLLSSVLAALVNQGAAFTAGGVVPGRMGNQHPSIAPYELLPTADGGLVLAVGNDRQFATLCEVIGVADLARDARFATNPARVEHRAALRGALEGALAGRSAEQWAATLTEARVPAGVVNDVAAAFGLAQRLGLEPVVSLARGGGGPPVPLARNPIRMSETPPTYRSPPPPLPPHGPAAPQRTTGGPGGPMDEVLRYAAFSDDPSGGNPAGVVLAAGGWDAAAMQEVAAAVGYSETAFVTSARGDGGLDVRYFSPVAEVPFCGHATIATAVAWGERHGFGTLRMQTRAGLVTVDVRPSGRLPVATLTSVAPHSVAVEDADLAEALAALGWAREQLDPAFEVRAAYAGAHHLVLAAATLARLEDLDYDFDRLGRLMRRLDWTTVQLVHRTGPHHFRARNPFPPGGVVEDPATGAAAAAFGGYLRELDLLDVPAEIVVRQGEEIGRPSLLRVGIPAEPGSGIRVSGTAVPID